MNEIPDEALMLAYQAGDAGAFDTLYQRHRGRLFRFLVRESGSTASGEEIYQEAWLRVIRARGDYHVGAAFGTWLYRIAHNCLVDFWRRQGRLGVYEVATDTLPESESCVLTPEQEWQRELSARALRRCMDDLPIAQREVFLLKEESDFSLADIAAIVGIDAETAKSRLRYALKKLRLCLEAFA